MSAHTPTPVRYLSGSRSIYDADDRCLCIVPRRRVNGTNEETNTRGMLIVKCVNSHDELVAALREIAKFGDNPSFSSAGTARAALAKAEAA